MRIESIFIKNYRQYRDIEFNFPKTEPFDLHIVIGSNGVGKTNLLNAITWCFYGSEPRLRNDSKTLPIINLETLKECNEGNYCDVDVTIHIVDNGTSIIFKRSKNFRVAGQSELPFGNADKFIVTEIQSDGNSLVKEGEETSIYVNRYVPERIREYFFFDGEQLDAYFLGEQGKRIQDSIYAISQVQLLTRIFERLNVVKNELRKEMGNRNPDIKKLTEEFESISSQIVVTKTTIDQLKEQISISSTIIQQRNEFLKGQADIEHLERRTEELKQLLTVLEEEKSINDLNLKKFIREYKVLLTLRPYLHKVLNTINTKEAAGALPPNIDKILLEKMIASDHCLICDRPLTAVDKKHVELLLEQISVTSYTSHLLVGIKNDLIRKIEQSENYLSIRNDILASKKRIEDEIGKNHNEATLISNQLSNYSNKEEIKNAHNERAAQEKLKEENLKKLGVQESFLNQLEIQLEEINKSLNKAISAQKEQKKFVNQISFVEKATSIVAEIEAEMMSEVQGRMEERTHELFNKLVWKKNTYAEIKIDENYCLDLIHQEGYSCIGSCSAAERALLALSFTLALHRVSGFNSSLVIDTPVSRISDENRINFAEVLKEVSKEKQIIMLFAPSEYSEEIAKTFDSSTSTRVRIQTDDERTTHFG